MSERCQGGTGSVSGLGSAEKREAPALPALAGIMHSFPDKEQGKPRLWEESCSVLQRADN